MQVPSIRLCPWWFPCGLFRLRRPLLSDDHQRCVWRRPEQRDALWKTSDFVVANLNSWQQVTVYLSEWRLQPSHLCLFHFFFLGVVVQMSVLCFHIQIPSLTTWATRPRGKRAQRAELHADQNTRLCSCVVAGRQTVRHVENMTADLWRRAVYFTITHVIFV